MRSCAAQRTHSVSVCVITLTFIYEVTNKVRTMLKMKNWRSRTWTTFRTDRHTHEQEQKSLPNNGLEDPILVVNHCVGTSSTRHKLHCIIIVTSPTFLRNHCIIILSPWNWYCIKIIIQLVQCIHVYMSLQQNSNLLQTPHHHFICYYIIIMYQKCYCIIISVHQVIALVFTCTGYCISIIIAS